MPIISGSPAWRKADVSPPFVQPQAAESALASQRDVQLELGQAGGPHPSDRRTVESLLARQLAAADESVAGFEDLEPFETLILHPGRTLIEKLLRVNDFAMRYDDSAFGWPRIGRQYYDIWGLLGSEEVLAFLADRDLAHDILTDCLRVSELYKAAEPIPTGGFAACTAFALDGAMSSRLREQHDAAMRDLYYGSSRPPTFEETVERILTHRDLLDFGDLSG